MFPVLASNNPIHHILDKPVSGSELFTIHMAMLFIAAMVTLLILRYSAKQIAVGSQSQVTDRYLTKGRIPQVVEVITLYLRDKVIAPVLGKDTNRFLPYLLSVFYFILTCNLLGMIPFADIQTVISKVATERETDLVFFGGTATSNINVTIGLALVSFFVIQFHAFKSLGIGGWAHHLTGGAPLYLLPIMLPIEFMGMFIKPAALAIRLFANMVGGHTMLAVLTMFAMMTFEATQSWFLTGSIGVVSTIAAIIISFLELFVAFLQAFIFMFLTTVFIGQMSHHGNEHEEHALETTH
ncbi:MAG: F0F1 ATP synthase subunit A [Phycisphaerales bacterium]|jgi:F-type H+-transporting ATPase subunit a|nr:F0F1 ATP synthase subunit A [Phycisphaerales bacterium]|tara:strand:- start:436 stop:1323 length:888 start_codon:yes stop_codon:yes gene_type:complete